MRWKFMIKPLVAMIALCCAVEATFSHPRGFFTTFAEAIKLDVMHFMYSGQALLKHKER